MLRPLAAPRPPIVSIPQPIRNNPARSESSQVTNLPPPIGGWNQRDAFPTMPGTDALILENWIPDVGSVRLRNGYEEHATDLTGDHVESLFQYAPPDGNNVLFAATPDTLWDVTDPGSATSVETSLSNGRWYHAQIATVAGNYLYMVNGADTPRYWDGSTLQTSTFSGTGLTTSTLAFVHLFSNRLWFLETNTLNAWYAPTSSISGTLTKFLLPFTKGGQVLAVGSWTRDGGQGADDYIVFVSSRGECLIYAGTDPSSTATFTKVGLYEIPEAIGRRCFVRSGAELGILTSQGLVPLSQVLGSGVAASGRTAITDKIVGAFRRNYVAHGTNFGWQVTEYPKGNLVIVNVPTAERTTHIQFVMNTNTGAWCKFVGINSSVWSLLGDTLYFGTNSGIVYKFDVGYLDGTSPIVAKMQTAYSTFGTTRNKLFEQARPFFLSPPSYTPSVTIKTDYDQSAPALSIVSTGSNGSLWDVAEWDVADWGASLLPSLPWQSVRGVGVAGSVAFAVSSESELVYNGVDVMFQLGGMM